MPTSASSVSGAVPHQPCRRDRRGGYVLLELMLAMAILAMLAALAFPYVVRNTSAVSVRAKALEIASLLRTVRDDALRSGRTATVSFDGRTGRLRWQGRSVVLPRAFRLSRNPAGAEGFTFFADGRAVRGEFVLTAGAASYAVRVNGMTAAVDVVARGD